MPHGEPHDVGARIVLCQTSRRSLLMASSLSVRRRRRFQCADLDHMELRLGAGATFSETHNRSEGALVGRGGLLRTGLRAGRPRAMRWIVADAGTARRFRDWQRPELQRGMSFGVAPARCWRPRRPPRAAVDVRRVARATTAMVLPSSSSVAIGSGRSRRACHPRPPRIRNLRARACQVAHDGPARRRDGGSMSAFAGDVTGIASSGRQEGGGP